MKSFKLLLLFFLGTVLMTTMSCTKDSCTTTVTYKKYSPIYKTLDEMNQPVQILESKEIKETGKIFASGNYLLINELYKGIHIIDNSTPTSPKQVAYIEIAGNIDMAVKGNTLFADSYFDLLAFDFSDPSHPVLLNRVKHLYPDTKYRYSRAQNAYIVGQKEELVTEDVPCTGASNFLRMQEDAAIANSLGGSFLPNSGSTGPINLSGSMASMIIMGDYLYIINGSDLAIYSPENTPILQNTVTIGSGIETLFPYGDKLFIGSRTGMFIYDNSDPLHPVQLSRFMHFTSCDPVFVKDDIAYVTLRDGTPCQGATNQLDVIDVSNLMQPSLIKTYPMFNPHGLSVDEDRLYLCDGNEGLKVFGINDLNKITDHSKYTFPGMEAYDVLRMPNKELLIVIAKDGLYQFDLNNGIRFISKIGANK